MISRSVVLATFTLVLILISSCGTETAPEATRDSAKDVSVASVTDGDTIKVSPEIDGIEDVRFIGIDTPETAGSPRGGQPYGEEASEFSEEKLGGRSVKLRFDAEKKDQYDRLLAYVYLPDGSMFNETLLREGYAQVATFPPNVRHLNRFETIQRTAREAGRGIWSLPENRLCQLTDRGNGIGGSCP